MLISLFRVHGAVSSWHFASFRCAAKFVRYWSNNGHWSTQALIGLVANDPQLTLAQLD
jgi:hypothetical protein